MKPEKAAPKKKKTEARSGQDPASAADAVPSSKVNQAESLFQLDPKQFDALLSALNGIAARLENSRGFQDAAGAEVTRNAPAARVPMGAPLAWRTGARYDAQLVEFQAAPQGQGYPSTLEFMIRHCSIAEGREVHEDEKLSTLHNVRLIPLNADINAVYHRRAGVADYPGNRPDFDLTLRGAAFDIKVDLHHKGVSVPL